jgi:hypothetical protein
MREQLKMGFRIDDTAIKKILLDLRKAAYMSLKLI